jgi:DNA polymerase-4
MKSAPHPPAAGRAILHVDMDAFFASVETLDDPTLRGKPVIVGGRPESRGVVAAASYEARAFGIHSAMSSRRAVQLCPHAVFLAPRGARYAEISRHVFAILESFTPLVEPLSIDEAFLDVTGCRRLFGPPEAIGHAIKHRIREEIGLVASVGVAPNKFLAKLASDMEKPDGFVVIPADRAANLLADLPVSRIWGVGKVGRQALARLDIHTFRDLRDAPGDLIARHFGLSAEHLLQLAWGRDERPVVPDSDAKSVGAETTFAADIADAAELRRQLDRLVDRVARRLRRHGLRAQTIHLKARYPDFTTVTRAATLETATCSTSIVRRTARDLLERRLERAGRSLRLIGVSVSGLTTGDAGQPDLFPDAAAERSERLDRLVDRLRDKHGPATITLGIAERATKPESAGRSK